MWYVVLDIKEASTQAMGSSAPATAKIRQQTARSKVSFLAQPTHSQSPRHLQPLLGVLVHSNGPRHVHIQ